MSLYVYVRNFPKNYLDLSESRELDVIESTIPKSLYPKGNTT